MERPHLIDLSHTVAFWPVTRLGRLLALLLSVISFSSHAEVIVTCSPASTIFKNEGALPFTAVAVDSQLTLTGDAVTLASATVAMDADPSAMFGFINDGATMGNITAAYNAGTGVLTMSSAGATATLAQWQRALRAVTYNRTAGNAGNITKTMRFAVNDGTQNSMTSQKTMILAGGPQFVNAMEPWGICMNASASIDGLLVTEDYLMGSTVNYSVVTAPRHGSVALSGTPVVVNYTSFPASPITYTADSGYAGADSIVFGVSDGINSSQMTVRMSMDTAPPQPGGIIGQDIDTVGPNPVRYSIEGPIDSNAAYKWSYSGSNIFIGGTFFAGSGNPVDISFFPYPTATDGILSVTASNLCGSSAATTKSITVRPIQVITFDSLASTYYRGPDVSINAYSTSQLSVRFVVADASVGVVGTNFPGSLAAHPVNAGQTTITAYQDGEGGLQPATPVTRVFVVRKADQFINFFLPISFVLGADIAPTLNGTASSGLPLIYSSDNPRVAVISGDQISWLDSGTVTITATQAGNRNYNAAADAQITVTVLKPLPIGSTIYPNPSHGIFYFVPFIYFDASSYVLYNSSGQQVIAAPVVYSGFYREVRIQAGNAGPGVYILKVIGRLNGKDTTVTFKVLIL